MHYNYAMLMEAFVACQTGQVFASLGCLPQVRQRFSTRVVSETLMIFIGSNGIALPWVSSWVCSSRSYQLEVERLL